MVNNKTDIPGLIALNIRETDPQAEIILFGSRARGDSNSESDWDILVLTDYPLSADKEKAFRNHLYMLELEVEEPFSLFIYSRSEWENKLHVSPFFYNVRKDGVRL